MKYKDVIDPDICQIINNKHVDNLKIDSSNLAIDVYAIATKLDLKIKYTVIDSSCDHLDEIINNKTIYINRLWPIEKQRFWIAHQIGHYCLEKNNSKVTLNLLN